MRDEHLTDQEFTEKYQLANSPSWGVSEVRKKIRADAKWQTHLISCLYRPFDWRYCYFNEVAMDRPRRELIDHVAGKENICLLSSRQQATLGFRHVFVANKVANDCVISTTSREANQVFPLYLYPDPNKPRLLDTDIPS